jgi:hypothetical protein
MTGGLRYDRAALRGDYLRAALGFVFCGGAVWLGEFRGFLAWMFGGCALVFALFGARTALRSVAIYELTESGLKRSNALGWRWSERRIAWGSLAALKLRFFSTRRDRASGWMELSLSDGGATLRLDSHLEGFESIVRAATKAAAARRLAISDTTRSNLASLGVAVADRGSGDESPGAPPGPTG